LIESGELQSILSNLSHELCRPLTSLRAGFGLLLADPTREISPIQRGHIQTMVDLCEELLTLTRTHLDYAGLVQGAWPISFGTFTIGALVREIDRQFADRASAQRIHWVCGLEGADASVTNDASRCQQIFANLVSSALKSTREGGTVRVGGACHGRYWVVTVADDGHGIPAEEQGRPFEPLHRRTREDRSCGSECDLGLASSRELVAQLGGEISFHPAIGGQGTSVSVQFPLDASEQTPASAKRR
jgi:signal transduction histidine kinase